MYAMTGMANSCTSGTSVAAISINYCIAYLKSKFCSLMTFRLQFGNIGAPATTILYTRDYNTHWCTLSKAVLNPVSFNSKFV